MSGDSAEADVMVQWYRGRIAEPTTNDEVYGYWLFVFGILLGILGILLYLSSYPNPASLAGGAGIAVSAVALVLIMVGPVIRLPLRRTATLVSYAGALVSLLGVVWFLAEYPGWREAGVAGSVITLYAMGLVLIAVGAALVPVVRSRPTVMNEAVPTADDAASPDATDADTDEPEESQARFELYEDRAGKWRWRLRHRNGNIVADGGQGYSSRQKARQGLDSVKKNAGGAAVVREEVEADEPEEPADRPYPPGESQGTFEVYEDRGGDYRWRLVHDNGNIVADGGQGYAAREEAESAVERVREYVGPADYLRVDPAAFEVYEDAAEEWRWRLFHRNGEILADGGEGYASRSGAREAVERVRERIGEDDAIEVFEDEAGEYRWRLTAGNGEIIADGGQGFASERGARQAVERVREHAPEADALDYDGAAFELYEDAAGEWRWHLRHENGRIMGDSGEGYASRTGVIDGVRSVKRNAPNADTDLLDSGEGA